MFSKCSIWFGMVACQLLYVPRAAKPLSQRSIMPPCSSEPVKAIALSLFPIILIIIIK